MVLGAVSRRRTVLVGAAGACWCLAVLRGGRAAVTECLHHLAAAHGFEDFTMSGAKHFEEGSFCGCKHRKKISSGLY